MDSAGYTNVFEITKSKADTTMTGLGGIQLSAAIVNATKLAGVAVGDITRDLGRGETRRSPQTLPCRSLPDQLPSLPHFSETPAR